MGLINRVVPEGEHLEAALEMAQKIAVIDTFSVSADQEGYQPHLRDHGHGQESLDSALEASCLIEAAVVPEREEFMEIARQGWLESRHRLARRSLQGRAESSV